MSDDQQLDEKLSSGQIGRVHRALQGGEWKTLPELHDITGDPVASISAQMRHLRRAGNYQPAAPGEQSRAF